MQSVRPVTVITGSNKFHAAAEYLNFRFSDAMKPVFVAFRSLRGAQKCRQGVMSLIHFANGTSVWRAIAAGGALTSMDRNGRTPALQVAQVYDRLPLHLRRSRLRPAMSAQGRYATFAMVVPLSLRPSISRRVVQTGRIQCRPSR